jgi:hypothetical protein
MPAVSRATFAQTIDEMERILGEFFDWQTLCLNEMEDADESEEDLRYYIQRPIII